jgi:carbon storage regulator
MLVIPRKKGQGIVVGEDIFITVMEIRGDRVRLAVECPKEVPFHREEVRDAIRRAEEARPPKAARRK